MALLAVAVVGGGFYYASQRSAQRVRVREDHLAQVAALARAEKDTEWLQRAIREKQAILGMTAREVEQAKGQPALKQRGDTLPESDQVKGGVENWIYDSRGGQVSVVLFGAKGFVIYSSDVGDKPGPGQAIRQ